MKVTFLRTAFFMASMALLFTYCYKDNTEAFVGEEIQFDNQVTDRDNCCYFKYKTSVPIGLDVYASATGGAAHYTCSGEPIYHTAVTANGYPGPCDGNFKAHFHRTSGSGAFVLKIGTSSGGLYSINVPANAIGIDVKFEGCQMIGYEFCGPH